MEPRDNAQPKSAAQMVSPPPHLTSFQNALSDYSTVYETAPDIPARGYEGKGKLYTVPESDSYRSPQSNIVNWDDSDAEERVLKELQQNLERDKQRQQQQQQQAPGQDRKVAMVTGDTAVDNHGYVPSPTMARSNESILEKWTRANEAKQVKSPSPGKRPESASEGKQKFMVTDISDPAYFKPPSRSGMTPPSFVGKDPSGKRCVFYFEEGSPHYVEVEEGDVDATLPAKVDEFERLIRRVWREVFATCNMATSIFVFFIVELILYLIHHIARPLVLDTITAVGDYLLKPLLTVLFNSIIQPVFSFLWNTFSALGRALEPLYRILTGILTPVAMLVKAFRLYEVNTQPARYRHELDVV